MDGAAGGGEQDDGGGGDSQCGAKFHVGTPVKMLNVEEMVMCPTIHGL
jgi:hypothetical protein